MTLLRPILATLLATLVALSGIVLLPPVAEAQTLVTGAADFRDAPQLSNGTYRDTLVSGDSAWYQLIYANDTPYRFEVTIDGARPSGISIEASFVAPTLDVIDGPAEVVDGNGVTYPLGATNTWFLKVSMPTVGQVGVELPIVITVDGVESFGTDDCADTPGCNLDIEYEQVQDRLVQARAALEGSDARNTLDAVERELTGLRQSAEGAATITRPQAEARLARAEAALAELCAPDPSCEEFPDPGTKTPPLGLLIGVAALAFGAFKALQKIRGAKASDDEPEDDSAGDAGPYAREAIAL